MWKACQDGDLALRFQARFGGPECSGITLILVWSTGDHGTAGRRVVKHGLHIFPCDFGSFWGANLGEHFSGMVFAEQNARLLKNSWKTHYADVTGEDGLSRGGPNNNY